MQFILFVLLSAIFSSVCAQDGYIGYSLTERGDPNDVIYDTASTHPSSNISTTIPPPDVYLNASVHIGEIDIEVQNLTAQINLAAQVLQLLQINAGVDASVQRVSLTIQNVTAHVTLEARLANIVTMISDVLDSLDLNPILATLGEDVGQIVNSTTSALSSSSSSSNSVAARSNTGEAFTLAQNILYSVNDYSGNTHTNRILSQSGNIVDESLDNDGRITGRKVVGSYNRDMHYTGHSFETKKHGESVTGREYSYHPFPGLSVISAVYIDPRGAVVATQVLSEGSAGGSSTISDDESA